MLEFTNLIKAYLGNNHQNENEKLNCVVDYTQIAQTGFVSEKNCELDKLF